MPDRSPEPLYRHLDIALLRAARLPRDAGPTCWPDLTDPSECRRWLAEVGANSDIASAVQHASPSLATCIDRISRGEPVADKDVCRTALSLARYWLRATGRSTPFGHFAGVAPAALGGTSAKVRWGNDHETVIAPDAQWLRGIVEQLEGCPPLLDRLEVVFNDLAVRRGSRLEWPRGSGRVTIQYTSAVRAVSDIAASPVRFADLVDRLGTLFPATDEPRIRGLLTSLVAKGFLITSLRAPLTEIDPLGYVLDHLRSIEAHTVASVASTYRELAKIATDITRHNRAVKGEQPTRARETLTARMTALSGAGRTPLAIDLRLDCEVHLPTWVAEEVQLAASALARLTRQPTGEAPWREYYTAFCDRYGMNALVPLSCVVHPETGLGLPATYPGSVLRSPTATASEREGKLLSLAWRAMADGSHEVVLTDDTIRSLAVGDPDEEPTTPPHVEMSARIQATSGDDLERGDYLVFVQPARAAGTLTSRHQQLLPEADWAEVYRRLPTATEGALRAQLSFPPNFPHAENICRVPAYLPQVLSLGEHRRYDDTTIAPADLAVMATNTGLHLVSMSRQQVIEPEVFHPLALDTQPPALARFLAHITQGNRASWHRFDWGPQAADLPYLPRVRYRRSILSPARWRLTSADLPTAVTETVWHEQLVRWCTRWRCPELIELVDDDRTLPLTPTEPSHAAILRAHLERHGHSVLRETITPDGLGWNGGHAHDLVLPLASTRQPAVSPLRGRQPLITNRRHGQLPGTPEARWLYAKVFTHPERMDEVLGDHVPTLLSRLGQPDYWFARYRSAHEADHIRLRLRATGDQAALLARVGDWVQHLREHCLAGRLVIDTYHPETGRYGDGPAMLAAENLFAADSRVVVAQLRHLSARAVDPRALAALNMVATVNGFLGSTQAAADWLVARPQTAPTEQVERGVADQVVGAVLRQSSSPISEWPPPVVTAWDDRSRALAAYRDHLPDVDVDGVVEALLHMHQNRALGVDRKTEAACRALARRAALAIAAQRDRGHQ